MMVPPNRRAAASANADLGNLTISSGTFSKALGFADLIPQFIALACFIPVLTALSVALLRKQEK